MKQKEGSGATAIMLAAPFGSVCLRSPHSG